VRKLRVREEVLEREREQECSEEGEEAEEVEGGIRT
jgi:hypothetical protein